MAAILLRPGGRIDVAGDLDVNRRDIRSPRRGFVIRLDARGGLLRRYGSTGVRIVVQGVDAAAVDRRGRTVGVARNFFNRTLDAFRLLPGGSLDRSFGSGGRVTMARPSLGEGRLAVSFSAGRPVIFEPNLQECRGGCMPEPVLIGLRGGGRR